MIAIFKKRSEVIIARKCVVGFFFLIKINRSGSNAGTGQDYAVRCPFHILEGRRLDGPTEGKSLQPQYFLTLPT